MKSIFTIFFILVLTGCNNTDEAILCDTGPVVFTFEVVNETTGENLFEDESFEENQLQIANNNGETVEFDFETERNVVDVLLGWESKSDVYTLIINEEIEFNIAFTLEESSSGGCTSTGLTELEMAGATYETSETSGITTIYFNSEGN